MYSRLYQKEKIFENINLDMDVLNQLTIEFMLFEW